MLEKIVGKIKMIIHILICKVLVPLKLMEEAGTITEDYKAKDDKRSPFLSDFAYVKTIKGVLEEGDYFPLRRRIRLE